MSRAKLMRSMAFWTISIPFALALLAQIGFIVHQIALLEPKIGRANAGFAVSVMTFMAIVGRLGLGTVVDRFDPRFVTVPLLFVAAEKDRLTPPDVVRRAARYFAHVSDYVEYPGQGHWVLGQPGWERVADAAATWLDDKTA